MEGSGQEGVARAPQLGQVGEITSRVGVSVPHASSTHVFVSLGSES